MSNYFRKRSLILAIFLALLFLGVFFYDFGYAQETSEEAVENNTTINEQKEELQKQLEELQRELESIQVEVNKYNQESASYERDINILGRQIRGIQIEMQRNRVMINQTDLAIRINQDIITELNTRSAKQKELLADIILGIYKLDGTSSVEMFLGSSTLSEFFNDVARIKNLQEGLKGTLDEIKEIKTQIEEEQKELEVQVDSQTRLLQAQQIQGYQLGGKVDEKETLLEQSESKELEYEELAQQKQKGITEVRNQIFRLEGAGVAITFEDAYGYAKTAFELTGVRPAFLLSVLKQESSWGKNVGLCLLHNKDNGDGIGVNTGTIYPRTLKVSRDIEPFFQIMEELGRDPYNTRISCWPQIYWDGEPYGYGGAMGPAQFLPSTWMGYRDRVATLLGRPADPWLIQDAFLASAVKLSNAGASKNTYDAEWCAALIYYSGRCPGNSINWFYPNQIMDRAEDYQRDINVLVGG